MGDMIEGRDHIGVGVGAMILNEEGLIFLAKRGPAARNERGAWEFPGGGVRFDERMVDAIRREIREEYGIEIEVWEQLGAFDHILPREKQHWVSVTFIASLLSGVPRILEPEKCEAIGWFSLDMLPEPLSVVTEDSLSAYLTRSG